MGAIIPSHIPFERPIEGGGIVWMETDGSLAFPASIQKVTSRSKLKVQRPERHWPARPIVRLSCAPWLARRQSLAEHHLEPLPRMGFVRRDRIGLGWRRWRVRPNRRGDKKDERGRHWRRHSNVDHRRIPLYLGESSQHTAITSKLSTKNLSPGGAVVSSPGREPWVTSAKGWKPRRGDRVYRPSGASVKSARTPRACALGY